MAASITLIPLLCPQCRAALPAQVDEVAWRCDQCGNGWHLNEAQPEHGLEPLTIYFDARLDPRVPGHPFWVTEGRVALRRETYSGNQTAKALEFWSQPRRFFIPAYTCPLETLIQLGMELLRQPPELRPGQPAPHAPITLPRDDVKDMAEFIIVGVEAERSDQVRTVGFQLQLSQPELWVLP